MVKSLLALFALHYFLVRDNLFENRPVRSKLRQRVGRLTTMVRVSGERDFRIQQTLQALTKDPFRTLPELAEKCQISPSRPPD